MGIVSDALKSQIGAVIVLMLCLIYLAFLSPRIKDSNKVAE